jgi:hypothetical protein
MPNYNSVKEISAVAGEDLTDKVGYFVEFDSAAELVVATTAQAAAAGVLTLEGLEDRTVKYAVPDGGHVPVMAGEAIAVGDKIAVGADGRAVALAAGGVGRGVALEASTAADQLIKVAHYFSGIGAE